MASTSRCWQYVPGEDGGGGRERERGGEAAGDVRGQEELCPAVEGELGGPFGLVLRFGFTGMVVADHKFYSLYFTPF